MKNNPCQTLECNIIESDRLRTPQREAYAELARFTRASDAQEREIGIVLPQILCACCHRQMKFDRPSTSCTIEGADKNVLERRY